MKPLHYEAICKMLLERFGEPIGDREAPPTSGKKKDMGNRGFGSAKLDESGCCEQCGMMAGGMEQGHSCGMDQATAIEGSGDLKGKPCKSCGKGTYQETSQQDDYEGTLHCNKCGAEVKRHGDLNEDELDEKTPPGGEKVVKALKKDKKVKNPWAVAWSMKDKGEF